MSEITALENFIGGKFVTASAKENVQVTTPHDGSVIANCPVSSAEDVSQAVDAAKTAFAAWSARTIKDRAQVMIRYHNLIVQHADELADLIVREHGKTKTEALAEISKGNETVEYACAAPELAAGRILEVSRGVTCVDHRVPIGVVAMVVPFNFPFMVPHWTIPIALVMGNTIVLKPSEKVPLTMTKAADLLAKAGVPDGVFNIVHGTAPVVQSLCEHPDVAALTFVGTSHVAELLHKKCSALNKRALCLGGAKNHLVAAPDCDPNMAAQDITNSFCGCSGQRCMAASVLLLVGSNDALVQNIVSKAQKLSAREVGPVIDQASLDKIHRYISEAESSGAKILLDGRGWTSAMKPGYFIGPTVILHSNQADKALHDEIFGPVLSILQVPDHEAALRIENADPHGNAACIYTTQGHVAEYYSKRFSAGMVGINIGVPVPREPFSFGGWNRSKFGEADITGDGGIEFFSRRRKVTTKWTVPTERSWLN